MKDKIRRISVVLPMPEAPTMATNSPGLMETEASSNKTSSEGIHAS
jgi:hypothetical protein